MDNLNKTKLVLEELYYFLRDEGFSIHSQKIKHLWYLLENNDLKTFKKDFKSSLLWGAAGSITDIDFREKAKKIILDQHLEKLKEFGSLII